MGRLLTVGVVALLAGSTVSSPALAQSRENVGVVINENSAESRQIGEYYARKRALPVSNVIRIRTSLEETVDRATFRRTIEEPIAAAISRERLHDRLLYLVLTKGVPLRVRGTSTPDGTMASVDSELTLLYRRMTAQPVRVRGPIPNPYFLGTRGVDEARRFTHRDHDIYLVSRLDAFTVEEALALVDRAAAPLSHGAILLDRRVARSVHVAERWLEQTASLLHEQGHGNRVLLDPGDEELAGVDAALGYYSWGSADPSKRERGAAVRLAAGSVAAMFVSSDARTFREPPHDWVPTNNWFDSRLWFGGSPQSLAADLIRAGATGVAGSVGEPYVGGALRPQILFSTYLAGRSLVEAFYLAMPYLSWQTIVVGDPLCSPFSRETAPADELDPGIHAATELPVYFALRRLDVADALNVHPDAVMAAVRAEARRARGDEAGARAALAEAIAADPRFTDAYLDLALRHDEADLHEAAQGPYRHLLELQPDNVVALNNLAYDLAVHGNALEEAKTLATRALSLAPENPLVQDTLGWISYLLGDIAMAARLLETAVLRAPNNAQVRLHAAFVYDARGERAAAQIELEAALRLEPTLANRVDVRALRARVVPPRPPAQPAWTPPLR